MTDDQIKLFTDHGFGRSSSAPPRSNTKFVSVALSNHCQYFDCDVDTKNGTLLVAKRIDRPREDCTLSISCARNGYIVCHVGPPLVYVDIDEVVKAVKHQLQETFWIYRWFDLDPDAHHGECQSLFTQNSWDPKLRDQLVKCFVDARAILGDLAAAA